MINPSKIRGQESPDFPYNSSHIGLWLIRAALFSVQISRCPLQVTAHATWLPKLIADRRPVGRLAGSRGIEKLNVVIYQWDAPCERRKSLKRWKFLIVTLGAEITERPVGGRDQWCATTSAAAPKPTITTAIARTDRHAGRERRSRLARLGRDVSTIIVTEP